jgi:hypothetical protein
MSLNLIVLSLLLGILRQIYFPSYTDPFDGTYISLVLIFFIWCIYFIIHTAKFTEEKLKKTFKKTTIVDIKRNKELLDLGVITQEEYDKVVKAYRVDNQINL